MKLFRSKKDKKKAEAKKTDPKYQVELGELMRLSADQPALRSIFYERLWAEKLILIPLNQDIPVGTLDSNKHSQLEILKLSDGRTPVFTSEQRIYEGNHINSNVIYIEIKGKDLFPKNTDIQYVLNPFSQFGKNITHEEIEKIEKGEHLYDLSRSSEISPENEIEIIIPEKYPAKLMDDLIILFREMPDVDRAYIVLLKHKNSHRSPNYTIALRTDDKFDEISTEIGIIAEKHLAKDQIIEVMNLTTESHFWNFFRHRKPFYRRDM